MRISPIWLSDEPVARWIATLCDDLDVWKMRSPSATSGAACVPEARSAKRSAAMRFIVLSSLRPHLLAKELRALHVALGHFQQTFFFFRFQIAHDLAGRAEHEHAVRNHLALRHQCA